jgi:hypothetical protein
LETAEQWIKPISQKQSGRGDMIALWNHYLGEANTSQRIAVATKTRDTLHYKSERAMSFSLFLDKIQKMFNIFDEEGEAISTNVQTILLPWFLRFQISNPLARYRVLPSILNYK